MDTFFSLTQSCLKILMLSGLLFQFISSGELQKAASPRSPPILRVFSYSFLHSFIKYLRKDVDIPALFCRVRSNLRIDMSIPLDLTSEHGA